MCFHNLPHLYAWCSKISTCGMCFHKNLGMRMCILMKIPRWQGNAIVFPAFITIVLGNAYVLKRVFFVFPQWLKSVAVAVFPAQAHPNEPLFLPETLHISRWKAKATTWNDMQREKRNFPKSHDNCQKKHQNLTPKKIQNITERTKPIAKLNITST